MAVDGRINVRHEEVFPVLVLGVEPINDFESVKAEPPQRLLTSTRTCVSIEAGTWLTVSHLRVEYLDDLTDAAEDNSDVAGVRS